MLVGDYSEQCRRYFGRCSCSACRARESTRYRKKIKSWLRRLLGNSARTTKRGADALLFEKTELQREYLEQIER